MLSTRTLFSDASNAHTDNKPADRSATTTKIDDASTSSISTLNKQSLRSSASSTHRLQKQSFISSLHGRATSQILSPQSNFSSMISGLNYSLPQLNNIDSTYLFASHDAFGQSHAVESLEPTQCKQVLANTGFSEQNDIKPPQTAFEAGNPAMKLANREEEENRMAEFTTLEDSLKSSLQATDLQLKNIQTTCTNLSSTSDMETVEIFSSQFARSEQQLVQLTALSNDVIEITDSVEVVKAIQERMLETTRLTVASRKLLGETQEIVQTKHDAHQCEKVEMNQLREWLSNASRQIRESTERLSVNTVTAEQQLGQLLTLVHEFNAHKGRFQDLDNCAGLERNSVIELRRHFEHMNDVCHVSMERHRHVFAAITDVRNEVKHISSWVVKTGPIYSLDNGLAAGSLDMLELNHSELENKLQAANQLRDKASEFLTNLCTTDGEGGQVQEAKGHLEDELNFMQPVLEAQCQLYQLRELLATRAANMV